MESFFENCEAEDRFAYIFDNYDPQKSPLPPRRVAQPPREVVFKHAHLQQLLDTNDYLNLTLGFVHGDILPKNLFINSTTNQTKIFHFNFGSKLGSKWRYVWQLKTSDVFRVPWEKDGDVSATLSWPNIPEPPRVDVGGGNFDRPMAETRADIMRRHERFITWARMPTCALPPARGQRLLANGELAPARR
ncbi:hypothetical protein B0T24DRAFT_715325 [Lasiosphaeria ovina]|uniref:Protein kinase domain-containing protein n=1 Tax=Lasiosphaeria ovina TaxID=92902 RepID=A0AAE0TXT6_9PEZI|nr:hypothetical protein B0T24DRAFT_715325 [Lasiosphaeria ovina]